MSTWAVSQPRTSKRYNLWRSCISPARYICISTAIKTSSKSASGRHRRVDHGGISTARAAYQQQSKLKRKHFWSTQPCRPGRCINHNQHSEITSGAAVYHQRGIAVYPPPSKIKTKAFLDDTAVSTWAVSQPRTSKQNNLWRSCKSPARYSCISTVIENSSKSASGRHRRVDQGGKSTARVVNKQQSKLKRKHFWTTQPCRPGRCVNRESWVPTAIKNLNGSTSGPCRPGRFINRDQQSKIISGAAVYHQRTLSTVIEAKSCLAQRYLPRPSLSMSGAAVSTRVMYQPRSAKQKHIRRSSKSPARSIDCDQRTESLSGAAVYQQQSAQQPPLRHRPADICKIASTSVYQQWAAEPKAHLDHATASIRAVNHPRSAKRMPAATSEQIMYKKQNDIGTRHTAV